MPRRSIVLKGTSLLAGVWLVCVPSFAEARQLTFEERVEAQRAIEEVYWRHRIWPKENQTPKPPLSAVMPDAAIREKVEEYVERSNALAELWHRPITSGQLHAEINRMESSTRDAEVLRELFDALGGDPFLIEEILARQALAGRLVRQGSILEAPEPMLEPAKRETTATIDVERSLMGQGRTLGLGPTDVPGAVETTTACIGDTWSTTSGAANVPSPRSDHTAVWTGAEMIIWGGTNGTNFFNTGGRYSPSTDTWSPDLDGSERSLGSVSGYGHLDRNGNDRLGRLQQWHR